MRVHDVPRRHLWDSFVSCRNGGLRACVPGEQASSCSSCARGPTADAACCTPRVRAVSFAPKAFDDKSKVYKDKPVAEGTSVKYQIKVVRIEKGAAKRKRKGLVLCAASLARRAHALWHPRAPRLHRTASARLCFLLQYFVRLCAEEHRGEPSLAAALAPAAAAPRHPRPPFARSPTCVSNPPHVRPPARPRVVPVLPGACCTPPPAKKSKQTDWYGNAKSVLVVVALALGAYALKTSMGKGSGKGGKRGPKRGKRN